MDRQTRVQEMHESRLYRMLGIIYVCCSGCQANSRIWGRPGSGAALGARLAPGAARFLRRSGSRNSLARIGRSLLLYGVGVHSRRSGRATVPVSVPSRQQEVAISGASPRAASDRLVSTMAGKPRNIDEYLSSVTAERRRTLERLRQTVLSILPAAEECISYSMPAFRFEGHVVAGFLATKAGCSYFPFSGTTLATLANDLTAYEQTKSALHFDVKHPLSTTLVRKLLKARLAEVQPRVAAKAKSKSAARSKAPSKAPSKRGAKAHPTLLGPGRAGDLVPARP